MMIFGAPDRAAGAPWDGRAGAPVIGRQLLARPLAVFGLAVIFAVVALAVVAPWVTPYNPGQQHF